MADTYVATTRSITVTVQPFYLADQSKPDEDCFLWGYRVTIRNDGTLSVQLMRRTWRIIDGRNRVINVEGLGVVGEQPLLEPGESFEYTSGTPLETPSGFMQGQYHMIETASGDAFDVEIPIFSLDSPHTPQHRH